MGNQVRPACRRKSNGHRREPGARGVRSSRTRRGAHFTWLIVTRFILGVGIGGDYPVSATIMTEYASRGSRGRQVAIMFSSYTFGSITALITGVTPHASLAGVTAINLILAVLFSLTGVIVCIALMDRIGRKLQQNIGFLICGGALLAIGLVPGLTTSVVPFALVFGLASFGSSVGPTCRDGPGHRGRLTRGAPARPARVTTKPARQLIGKFT